MTFFVHLSPHWRTCFLTSSYKISIQAGEKRTRSHQRHKDKCFVLMALCNTCLIFPAAASKGTASPEDNELRRSPGGYQVAFTRHSVVMFLKDDKLLTIFTLCCAANEFYSRCEKELRALSGVKAITKFYNPICKRLTLLWSPLQPFFHLQLTLQQGLSVFLWWLQVVWDLSPITYDFMHKRKSTQ